MRDQQLQPLTRIVSNWKNLFEWKDESQPMSMPHNWIVSHSAIQKIMKELGYPKVCVKWIRRQLTPDIKERRMEVDFTVGLNASLLMESILSSTSVLRKSWHTNRI